MLYAISKNKAVGTVSTAHANVAICFDVGYKDMGYAVGDLYTKDLIECGLLQSPSNLLMEQRLLYLSDTVDEIFEKYVPSCVFYENPVMPNVTGQMLQRVVGVISLLAAEYTCSIQEFAPKQMKKIVTGSGEASKADVIHAVRQKFPELPGNFKDDVYDAVGIFISAAQ